MTSKAHTPAPWTMRATNDELEQTGLIFGGENGMTHICDTGAAYWYNAKARGVAGMDTVIDQCNANARLIAAAPELLEALQLILPRAEGFAINIRNMEERLQKARAAIAKATGE